MTCQKQDYRLLWSPGIFFWEAGTPTKY